MGKRVAPLLLVPQGTASLAGRGADGPVAGWVRRADIAELRR